MEHEIIATDEGVFYRNKETGESVPAQESYFNCPVEICRESVVAPLEQVKDKAEGEVKEAIEKAISFLKYCFVEHSSLEWVSPPDEEGVD